MDLVWSEIDGNGWPVNPMWHTQQGLTKNGYYGPHPAPATTLCHTFLGHKVGGELTVDLRTPPCTTTPLSYDSDDNEAAWVASLGSLCESSIPGSVNGHINWMPDYIRGSR